MLAMKASHYIDSNVHSALTCRICLGALPLQDDNFLKSGIWYQNTSGAKSVNLFTSVAEKKCTLMYLIPEDNLRAMKLITGQVEASSNGLETQSIVIGTVNVWSSI